MAAAAVASVVITPSAGGEVRAYPAPAVACEISERGADGQRGRDGVDGRPGQSSSRPGENGRDGDPGRRGGNAPTSGIETRGRGVGDGGHGTPGTNATHATPARNISVKIRGTPDALVVEGSHQWAGSLGANGVLVLNAAGGNGGDGGRGGNGGAGGRGGSGGRGGRGGRGKDQEVFGRDGGKGEPGGDGANGGDGGNGGNGANGGAAGHGANGGNIKVTADDPTLLSLVRLYSSGGRPGRPGDAGSAGPAGEGGSGGSGGAGGPGGRAKPKPPKPSGCPAPESCGTGNMGDVCGHCGEQFCKSCGFSRTSGKMRAGNVCANCNGRCLESAGRDGSDGQAGRDGRDGSRGSSGRSGTGGNVANGGAAGTTHFVGGRHKGSSLYNISIDGYTLRDEDDDGIFEPCSRVLVTDIAVSNPGSMPLPEGSVLAPAALGFCAVEGGAPIAIPALAPGGGVVLPGPFSLVIADMPAPGPAPFAAQATLSTHTMLLGRMYGTGALCGGVPVQWPVKFGDVHGPPSIGFNYPCGPGQNLNFNIDVFNISLKPIEVGALFVRVTLPPALGGGQRDLPLSHPVMPGAQATVAFPLTCAADAMLFSQHTWTAELVFKGRPIELLQRTVKVAAQYKPSEVPADVLLFVGPQVNLPEFQCWSRILTSLGLSYDLWDVDGNFGVSLDTRTGARHEVSWVGRHLNRMLLFPAHSDQVSQMLLRSDIAGHLNVDVSGDTSGGSGGASGGAGGGTTSIGETVPSVVLFGADPIELDRQLFELSTAEPVVIGPDKFTEMHTPLVTKADSITEYSMEKRARQMVHNAEKDGGGTHRYEIVQWDKEVTQKSVVKFSYGTLTLRAMPIPRGPRVRFVNGPTWLAYSTVSAKPRFVHKEWAKERGLSLDYVKAQHVTERRKFDVLLSRFNVFLEGPVPTKPVWAGVDAPSAAAPVPVAGMPPIPPGGAVGAPGAGGAGGAGGVDPMSASAPAAGVPAVAALSDTTDDVMNDGRVSLDPFNALADNIIPVPSRFAQAITLVVQGMSVARRVRMLYQTLDGSATFPAKDMTFRIAGSAAFLAAVDVSFGDLLSVSLYNDLKSEYRCQPAGYPMLSEFISAVEAQGSTNKAGMTRAWGIVLRLKNSTVSAKQLFGDSKAQRTQFLNLHRRLKTHVLGGDYKTVKKSGAPYKDMRGAAEAWAGSKSKVKLRDLAVTVHLPTYEESEAAEMVRTAISNKAAREKSMGFQNAVTESVLGHIGDAVRSGFRGLWLKRQGRK